MKLSTAETKQYAVLAAQAQGGGMTPAQRSKYEALVAKMSKPEPRKKKAVKKRTPKPPKP
jgi:hypothetical protein